MHNDKTSNETPKTRRIGTTPGEECDVAVGSRWLLTHEPVTVMGIETAFILVSFENIQQYGTGTRKWLTHDRFALRAAPNEAPNTNPWPA